MSYTVDSGLVQRENKLREDVFNIEKGNKVEFWKNDKYAHIGIKVFPNEESGKQPMVLGFNARGGKRLSQSILSVFGCGPDGEIWLPDPLLLEKNGAKMIMTILIEQKAADWLNKVLCKGMSVGYKYDHQIEDNKICGCSYKEPSEELAFRPESPQIGDRVRKQSIEGVIVEKTSEFGYIICLKSGKEKLVDLNPNDKDWQVIWPHRLECQTKGINYSFSPFNFKSSEQCLSILKRIFGDTVYEKLLNAVESMEAAAKSMEAAKPAKSRPFTNYYSLKL